MPAIENRLLSSFDMYFSAVERVEFFPGVNLISDEVLARLEESSEYQRLVKTGVFRKLNTAPDTTLDTGTELEVVTIGGEKVPVSEAGINKTVARSKSGKTFTMDQLTKNEIPVAVASQIALKPPSGGWTDGSHIADALQIQDEGVKAKIDLLFS